MGAKVELEPVKEWREVEMQSDIPSSKELIGDKRTGDNLSTGIVVEETVVADVASAVPT